MIAKTRIAKIKFATGPASIISARCHLGLDSKVFASCSLLNPSKIDSSSAIALSDNMAT